MEKIKDNRIEFLIPEPLHIELKNICKLKSIKISSYIRSLIIKEISKERKKNE